jgi:hypothetical protein
MISWSERDKAFSELATGDTKERLMSASIIGCDGLPDSGQLWVKQGMLTATVVLPVLAGKAVEMLVTAIRNNTQPKELALINAVSYPPIDQLKPVAAPIRARQENLFTPLRTSLIHLYGSVLGFLED